MAGESHLGHLILVLTVFPWHPACPQSGLRQLLLQPWAVPITTTTDPLKHVDCPVGTSLGRIPKQESGLRPPPRAIRTGQKTVGYGQQDSQLGENLGLRLPEQPPKRDRPCDRWARDRTGLLGFPYRLGVQPGVRGQESPSLGLLLAEPCSTAGPRAQCLDWDVPGKKVKGPELNLPGSYCRLQCWQRCTSMPQLGLRDLGFL